MTQPFIHLRVHTEYSLFQSTIQIRELAERCAELQMPAVACTDCGTTAGAIDFCGEMQRHGIKPVIGLELLLQPKDEDLPCMPSEAPHLVLLAKDFHGYQNLCRLATVAQTGGDGTSPIERKTLWSCRNGLIAISPCLEGETGAAIAQEDPDRALQLAEEYADLFGADHFFLEIADHGSGRERIINEGHAQLSRKLGVGLVATNNVHYLESDDAEAHRVWQNIGQSHGRQPWCNSELADSEFHFKSAEEMVEVTAQFPGAVENTFKIAQMCNLDLERLAKWRFPNSHNRPEKNESVQARLRDLCTAGVRRKYNSDDDEAGSRKNSDMQRILHRLENELNTINSLGFTEHVLAVNDIVQTARELGMAAGSAHAGAAGSLVNYLLDITDADPIRHGLLFERFLNPGQNRPPEINLNFCSERRDELLEALADKYGERQICRLSSFPRISGAELLRWVATSLQWREQKTEELIELLPEHGRRFSFAFARDADAVRALLKARPGAARIFEIAQKLNRLIWNRTIHPVSIVIMKNPLDPRIPLCNSTPRLPIASYDPESCQDLGLFTTNLFRMNALTLLRKALILIHQRRGRKLELHKIPLNDWQCLRLFSEGKTEELFHFHDCRMRELCAKLQIHQWNDLLVVLALCRPGAEQFIGEYLDLKTGRKSISYPASQLEPILKETYGFVLWQEQVLQILHEMAGMALGQADLVRRILGKRNAQEVKLYQLQFAASSGQRGHSAAVIEAVWNLLTKMTGYTFCKAHAVSECLIAYRLAFLKVYFPEEFTEAREQTGDSSWETYFKMNFVDTDF